MNIAKVLKYYRTINGLTQTQVSVCIGKERTTYTKYESGVAEPSIATLGKLAEIFNVPVEALLTEALKNPAEYGEKKDLIYAKTYQERDLITFFRQLKPKRQEALLKELKDEFLNG